MNFDQLKANWQDLQGKAKERWGELTDDELTQVEGETEQLIAKVQERYGIAKEEAREQVNEWLNELRDTEKK
ncbi:MAG: CsbD family protein [Anaerolineae bacterium]